MNHIQSEDTEKWEKNYLAKQEPRNTLTSGILSSSLFFLCVLQNTSEHTKQPSGGTASKIRLPLKQSHWLSSSLRTTWPLCPPFCPHQPVCLLTWGTSDKRTGWEPRACMAEEFQTHSTRAHNTTGQARINNTDRYIQTWKACTLWGGQTKIRGSKYPHSDKHTLGWMQHTHSHSHTHKLVLQGRPSSPNLFFQLKVSSCAQNVTVTSRAAKQQSQTGIK